MRLATVLVISLAGLSTGCVDAFPEVGYLNPWLREQWAEDEQFGPTYHRKVADLASLRKAARSLTAAEQERIAQELAGRLGDEKSPVMRAELVRTLGSLQAPSSLAAIQSSLADEHPKVRMMACQALGNQPTQESLQALAQTITTDTDQDVRIAAARELGRFQDPEAAKALRPALDDNDAALQSVAMQSLQSVTGRRQYGTSAQTWREYLDGGNPTPPDGPSLAENVRKYLSWY